MSKPFYDYILKLIVVGNSAVGKSNILRWFTDSRFQPTHDLTMGVEFGTKLISHQNTVYKIQIWDTAGQEAFKSITRSYYKGSIGCLLVYDITDRDSFNAIPGWLEEIRTACNEHMIIILIGNKIDLESKRKITIDEGQKLADENDLMYCETSSKSGENIDLAFSCVINEIGKKINKGVIDCANYKVGIQISKASLSAPIEDNSSWTSCSC
jgi:Ras-related protein Rab-2A